MKTRQQTRADFRVTMGVVAEGRGVPESSVESDDDQPSIQSLSPPTPPLRKRRAQAKSMKNTQRDALVRRTQGKLAGLLVLPVELFTEVTRHLSPTDIISLSRSNKFFRGILMQRSAGHIWRTALQNVPDLPPCPNDLCEPQYAALLFTKYCSLCGGSAIRSMDPYLNVRLCNTCREEQLVCVSEIRPEGLNRLIHQSSISFIKPGRNQVGTCLRAEKEEIEGIWADIIAGNAQLDEGTIAWVKETTKACKERTEYAKVLEYYLNNVADARSQELNQLKEQRRQEIKRRLEESGWEEQDWLFPMLWADEWTSLVEAPKPLTDRVWQKLYPQLIPFLEKNRNRHIAKSKAHRRIERKRRLHNLLINAKKQSSLLSVDGSVIRGETSNSYPGTTLPTNGTPASTAENGNADASSAIANAPDFILRAPFPPIVDALRFPIISDLLNEDIDADTLENKFEASRADIEKVILGWCSLVEQHYVVILGLGTWDPEEPNGEDSRSESSSDSGGSKPVAPKLELQFEPPPGSDFPGKLRHNTQLLLRADSVFCLSNDELCPPPLYYPDLFSVLQEKTCGYFPPNQPSKRYFSGRPKLGYHWNPNDVVPYPEAVIAAKALLHQLERPNAAQFELQALGARFSCGSCGELWRMTWNEIVQHYAEAQIHTLMAEQNKTPTTYINSHSLEFDKAAKGKGKPLVILHSPEESKTLWSGITFKQKFMRCNLCDELGIEFRAPRDAMLKHVRAVHAIKSPKANHYSRTSDILKAHIKINDPDVRTYDSDPDDSGSPLYEMDHYVMHFGAMARWMDWAPFKLCDEDWDTDKE
ncbi:hypothetical protein FRC11_011165 [Ceratobasidium sp. 423]|nr:hypothetical protein FRC11_011165 [Ceratobasidium sp. 423]